MSPHRSRARIGLVAAAVVLTCLLVPQLYYALWGLCLIVVIIGTYEVHSMGRHKGIASSLTLALAAGVGLMLCALLDPNQFLFFLPTIIVGLMLLSFLGHMALWGTENALFGVPMTIFTALYVALPTALAIQILDAGRGVVLLVFVCAWATDIAAYYIGTAFGRHKMAPHMSPKKSWEGAIGGVVACVAVALVYKAAVSPEFCPLSWMQTAVLALILSVVGQAGDLAESVLKRDAGVKDSGSIMMGHGGILDRIDSLLFCFMAAYVFLLAAGRMPGLLLRLQ